MTNIDLISAAYIIENVSFSMGDPDFTKGFNRGFYMDELRNSLDEIAFTTFFDEQPPLDLPFPKDDFILPLPKNLVDILQIHLFNGPCCTAENSVPVYWKKGMNNDKGAALAGGGFFYTAERQDDLAPNDTLSRPFSRPWWFGFGIPLTTVKYAGVYNGKLKFGPSCHGYEKVRLIIRGTYGDFDTTECIPRIMNPYVKHYVSEKYSAAMMTRSSGADFGKWRTMQELYDDKLNDLRTGSRFYVADYLKILSPWQRKSLREFLNKPLSLTT